MCQRVKVPFGRAKDLAFQNFNEKCVHMVDSMSSGAPVSRFQILSNITEGIFGPSLKTSLTQPQNILVTTEPPFIISELRRAIYSFNRNKAPGPDNIDHNLIRALFSAKPSLLLNIYNTLLRLQYFPLAWKTGELVYFRKEGRVSSDPKSYRPITLLPILGKIFEKLLLRRVNHHICKFGNLGTNQFGFMPGKSTEAAIKVALSHMDINKDKGRYTAFISIDIQGAFDSLPWKETITTLNSQGFNASYVNIISSFLSDRRALVDWLTPDYYHYFSSGCPQGSCLGPLLWIAFLDPLLKNFVSDGCVLIAYADDLLLIASGSSRADLERSGTVGLQKISNWANLNNIRISLDKSTAITFGKPTHLKRLPIFKINGTNIKMTTNFKYLGITLDKTLSFLPHLRLKRIESEKIIQNLYKFATKNGGVPKNILKIWYQTILQRKIAYACGVWYPRMQPSHGRRLLSSIQRLSLLLISRAYRTTSTAALEVLTGIPPLYLQLEKEAEFSLVSRLGSSMMGNDPKQFDTKCSKFKLNSTLPLIQGIDENLYSGDLKIYTDGSKTKNGTGAAFCAYLENIVIFTWRSRLNSENSVFQAEQIAIWSALNWFQNTSHQQVLILTDSLSSVDSFQNTDLSSHLGTDIVQLVQNLNRSVYINWVKGHSGIRGNEQADELAKSAAEDQSLPILFLPLPLSHLKYSLKCNLLRKWQTDWSNSETGVYTKNFLPKVSTDLLISNHYIFYFLTNHGPFQSYLFKINRSLSPLCVCGSVSDSLHYILNCPFTSSFHLKKPSDTSLHSWFDYIKDVPVHCRRIIECMKYIEKNEHILQNPTGLAWNVQSQSESSSDDENLD